MSEPNEHLENELRLLQPATVPPRVAAAIGDELENTAAPAVVLPARDDRRLRNLRVSLWFSWGVAAAAASFAVVVLLRAREPVQPAATGSSTLVEDRIVPVSTTNTLLAARDEGLVTLDDGMLARKMRLQFVDTVKLRASGEAALINVSYPREEIRFVPIQAY